MFAGARRPDILGGRPVGIRTSSQLDVHGAVPGADAASFDRAAHEAEQSCPVSRALRANVEIGVHATLDEPSAPSGSAAQEA